MLRVPFVIGITGGTGSGKTTLAARLLHKFAQEGVCLLEQDSYYRDRSHLSTSERDRINYDEPEAVEHDLLFRHLQHLTRGTPIEKPVYCFKTHTRSSEIRLVHPAPVILLEGLFALWDPRIRSLQDLKIYVDAAADIRFIRRVHRDVFERGRTVESVIDQYLCSVRPMHERYIEPTKAYADLVIQNNGDVTELLSAAEQAINQAFLRKRRNTSGEPC